ncbi:hypothetical protein [Stenotrophomonas acidaminiphila]
MKLIFKALLVSSMGLMATACVSTPVPKYQPSVENSSLILQARPVMDVGAFTASDGVQNRKLSMRGSSLQGGSDGTYATYLRDALIAELQISGGYVPGHDLRMDGQLVRNALNVAGVKTGSAEVGARFVLRRQGQIVYDKTLQSRHEWKSSFIGAIAIQAGIDNYGTTVQKLIGQLLADPEFIAATKTTASE